MTIAEGYEFQGLNTMTAAERYVRMNTVIYDADDRGRVLKCFELRLYYEMNMGAYMAP